MKTIILLLLTLISCYGVFSQNEQSFCDPDLQNEVSNISGLGGTYLKDFLISPKDLKIDNETKQVSFKAQMVLIKGNTYRFYLKSSTKIQCESMLSLAEKGSLNKSSILSVQQKSGDKVAFCDIKIIKEGEYNLVVNFKDNAKGCALVCINFLHNESSNIDTSIVYQNVDENAQFEGGDLNNFRNFVAMNFKIDTATLSKGFKGGKIIVQFVVNNSGRTETIEVLRSCGDKILDNEAISIIKKSSAWKPAKIRGVSVKQQCIIPIAIKLN
jgi:TonB family protein